MKYYSKDDAQHLLTCINKHYKHTEDWEGKNYCGMTLDWHYNEGYVDVSMPGYVQKSLKRLQHCAKIKAQHSPHEHVPIIYGKINSRQYASTPDATPQLTTKETKYMQQVAGSFLYYGRGIEYTILPALNEIAHTQAQPTETTNEKAQRLMDFLATNQNIFL